MCVAESGVLVVLARTRCLRIYPHRVHKQWPLKCSRSTLLCLVYIAMVFLESRICLDVAKSCGREASMLAFGVSFGSYVENDE